MYSTLLLTTTYKVNEMDIIVIIIPISQRLREVKGFVKGHKASEWQN